MRLMTENNNPYGMSTLSDEAKAAAPCMNGREAAPRRARSTEVLA
jgi:hypothetical protein